MHIEIFGTSEITPENSSIPSDYGQTICSRTLLLLFEDAVCFICVEVEVDLLGLLLFFKRFYSSVVRCCTIVKRA
jgi:hypothetical protein